MLSYIAVSLILLTTVGRTVGANGVTKQGMQYGSIHKRRRNVFPNF